MAIVKVIEVKGETKNAQKSFEDLGSTIQDQKDITIEFEKELARLESLLSNTSKSNLPRQKKLKDSIVQMKGALKDQRISVKELKNEQSKQTKVTQLNTESLSRNYGAIQILDQFTGGLASQFRSAVDASRLFNFQLKGMRTALIATGIGAFVVALGLVAVYWEEISEFITGANKELQKQIDLQKTYQGAIELDLEFNNLILDSLKLQGKSTDEEIKKRTSLLKEKQISLILENASLKIQQDKEVSISTELNLLQRIDNLTRGIIVNSGKASQEQKKLAKERADQINANQKLIIETQNAIFELENPKEKKRKGSKSKEPKRDTQEQFNDTDVEEVNDMEVVSEQEKLRKIQEINDFYYLQGLEREIAEIERKAQLDIDELIALGAKKEQIEAIEKASQDKIDEIVKVASDKASKAQSENDIKWSDMTAEAKLAIAGNMLNGLSGLVDKNSAAGKGIAIAQTGINTAQGIMKAFATLPTAVAIPAAAIMGTTGLLKTNDILSTKIPSATGRGYVSESNAGGQTPSAPSFNLIEGTEGNQINESINFQNQEPIQAYVVSGDVTTAQNLDDSIISESGL